MFGMGVGMNEGLLFGVLTVWQLFNICFILL